MSQLKRTFRDIEPNTPDSSSSSSTPSEPLEVDDRAPEVELEGPSKHKKHKEMSLNFSIESIMRPASTSSSSVSSISPGSESRAHQVGPSGRPTKKGSSGSSWSKERGSTNQLLRHQPVCDDPRLAPFECQLDNLELWHRFHPLDTEMIITKQGRRMFPPVRVTFSLAEGCAAPGPSPRDKYQVLMDILPYDSKRYRYAYHKSSWQQAGKADPPSPTKLFLHPDGPFTVEQLKRQVISFEKIKLTNNDANKHGYIVLNSMHKYQPRIHLVLWRGKESQNLANAAITQLEQETHKTFIFSETIFTAVTAYQNHSITKLKIDSNPFAKGFRDSSRLTDLELESMQDLMTDGQCPFSPPRAPPPGFPHLLFAAAAAQQSPGQAEDPAAALLRERTIMALDSFLQQHHHQQQQHHPHHPHPHHHQQQQQQQQQQHHHQHLVQPARSPLTRPAMLPQPASNQPQGPPPPYSVASFAPATFGSLLTSPQGPLPPGAQADSLDQFILQQRQFAAAMAAAAAAQHPLHGLFPPAGGALAGPAPCLPARQPAHRAPTPTTPTGLSLSSKSAGGGASPACQLSPVANKPGGQFAGATLGGATGHYPPGFHSKHLQAIVAAHHHHQQMAALSMQLEHQAGAQVGQAQASKFDRKNL